VPGPGAAQRRRLDLRTAQFGNAGVGKVDGKVDGRPVAHPGCSRAGLGLVVELGHASIAITKDVYGHLLEGDKRSAAESMSRALFGG
jgi:hypothetical protein